VIGTDSAPEFGGGGRSFSATDLLAAALGACMATSIDRVAERHGIPLDALMVSVEKTLANAPKRVARLAVTITVAAPIDPALGDRLRHAAESCPVHRSLHPDVEIVLELRSLVPEAT
jgi:putative redox protein